MNGMLSLEAASALIREGKRLAIAGDEALLSRLPRGQWIGGTIPYFMTSSGGVVTKDEVFVNELPAEVQEVRIRSYPTSTLSHIPKEYLDGFSLVVVPSQSEVHALLAREGWSWPGLFHRPLVGWVTGAHLSDLGRQQPRVFDGASGESWTNRAVVLHAGLAPGFAAQVEIANIFEQGSGPALTFHADGFAASRCRVDGREVDLADWMRTEKIDTRLPLVTDYSGSMINVSVQTVGEREVTFYAPVFRGQAYRFAKPVEDYPARFRQELTKSQRQPVFACNCILNFLYGALEGKRTGDLTGPITFGEIAYVLLNQTLVYLTIDRVP
jgi:hypothetical protein